jgi:hypothetical protein
MRWQMIDLPEDTRSDKFRLVLRLNSLGSQYFFGKWTLKRDKFVPHLHGNILTRFESIIPRLLFEMPRDHLKTTMITETRVLWRTLPFTEMDEILMRDLGYGDEWIRWMRLVHNPGRRTLICSETIDNASLLGMRFDWHFQQNELFRHAFSDILPNASCVWNSTSKQILSYDKGPNGEGTFDFIGVGAALQSRHYHDVVEDDVVGKDALEQESTMSKTHDYHRLLFGALVKPSTAEWTVVNNRWAPNDLSNFIRESNRKVPVNRRFIIEHHSALGGCGEGCSMGHPNGFPIFPEEFSMEDFDEIRQIQGPYFFSHQYLNLPVAPEECIFNPEWLRYYAPVKSPVDPKRHWLGHEVKAGQVIADVNPNTLIKSMVIDVNHSEERGRARHAVVVTGFDPETDRIYLLDFWAGSTSYDELAVNIFKLAKMWALKECWIEAIAGQRLMRYPLQIREKIEGYHLTPRFDLKTDRGANAKRDRIEALEPIFRQGQFWCRRDQGEFLDEYNGYPGFPTKDILDCLGYAPQTWNAIHAKRVMEKMRAHRDRWSARKTHTGY